ncbi:hypothetical protein AYK20_06115 [Thermoplasmatales archaeon SG8-52-1]|nr:MAG: hypothetical protein AYK20_06115 [Thermoplasmatales archaeon SG8-52-1]
MVKYCPFCKSENHDDAFWCRNCESMILKEPSETKNTSTDGQNNLEIDKNSPPKSFKQYEIRLSKFFIIIYVAAIVITVLFIYYNVTKGSDFSGINCKINEDFWFEEDKIITNDGWTFTMNKVQDYTLNGVVLALKKYNSYDYPYDPCNIFCPIDLLIGVDDVKDNIENYDYSITSFSNRQVYWYLRYDDVSEYNYFKSHTGNNHIIPHDEEVLNMLDNISVKDDLLIKGSLVNLYGTREDETLFRPTDTHIGNYACEVILVDEIILE